MPRYDYQPFDYVTPPGINGVEQRHKVAIVGAGPIGLALAIDLALKGVPSVLLDDNNVVSVGSRAICWAKRTLEIFDRLGIGERMLEKGVTWKVGRLFHGDEEVYNFDLLPEEGHKYPAFINLQQYYVEEYLVERARDFSELIDLRFKNKVVGHQDCGTHVSLSIETPDGAYSLESDYVIACDGARSPTRERMDLAFAGQTFEENFLIADVEMEESPFDTEVPERWFWFKPPFHQGQSALLHKQPDNIYRIDLQLGPYADPKKEANEENVLPRIRKIVGDKPFTLDWMSGYRFQCARLERFVHNRVIFAGDSAHVVSPFGARGGNGGIQDIDNLGWKLALVVSGKADANLLETYNAERVHGADENILNSARATNFMTPKSDIEHLFRDEVLRLAKTEPFARKLINSGRLSTPCSLERFSIPAATVGRVAAGMAAIDAPLLGPYGHCWLIEQLEGAFTYVQFSGKPLPKLPGLKTLSVIHQGTPCEATLIDEAGLATERYGDDTGYLFRPDGHIIASFSNPTPEQINAALSCAKGSNLTNLAAE